MKKLLSIVMILMVSVGLFASFIPYDIDVDTELDDMIGDEYYLELLEDGTINVEPYDGYRGSWWEKDLDVNMALGFDGEEWMLIGATYAGYDADDVYLDVGDEISEELGGWLDEPQIEEFVGEFLLDPTEEEMADLIMDEDFADIFGAITMAQAINEVLSTGEVENGALWLDDEVYAFLGYGNDVTFMFYLNLYSLDLDEDDLLSLALM